MRNRIALVITALVIAVAAPFAIVVGLVVWDGAAYIYACRMEASWSRANPQTRADLEQHLSLYTTRTIHPSQSDWGSNHQLAPGERMLQYRILGAAELDVVYDTNDRVRMIYTSYE